jgi:hypothetical protein
MEKEDKRICDKCNNFYVHPSGCTEYCQNKRNDSMGISNKLYYEERINGNIQNCKFFEKLF